MEDQSLKKHIEDNFDSKQAFANYISTPKKTVSRQQVSRWVKAGCKWIDGDVWLNTSKLTESKAS